MSTLTRGLDAAVDYPIEVRVKPATEKRNRLTSAFRIVLAVPHLLLVGGPVAAILSWTWSAEAGSSSEWSAGGGVLGVVAAVAAFIAWFAIVFTGRHPEGLWKLSAFYLRWRVRAVAYVALLRDEYPPFGDGDYPATLTLEPPTGPRDRITVAFRLILTIPHILSIWVLGLAWALTTLVAWVAILLTGRYPAGLYAFALGVLRWNVRVEAYLLLLRDDYPPFSL